MTTEPKQTVLNFGQKDQKINFKQCKDCGMMYNTKDEQDSEIHKRYHRQRETTLKLNSWRNEKVVKDYGPLEGRCLVIESTTNNKIALNKANQILRYVDTQLGIQNRISRVLNDVDTSLSDMETGYYKCYLFVCGSKILGFCLSENIPNEYIVKYMNAKGITYDKEDDRDVVCGVSRIWVDLTHRRRGIATKLLDCVRVNYIYYKTLTKNQIAFSDPTESGRCLALSYCNNEDILVYTKVNHHV